MAKNNSELAKSAGGTTALVPTHDYGDLTGRGFEGTSNSDFMIPFLNILQAQSPQVLNNSPTGARAGMLLNTVTQQLYEGKDGITIVPVCTRHCFVEWRPNQGGFVAIHELESEIVQRITSEQEFGEYKTPAGNDLVETYYIYALALETPDAVVGEPIMIAFTSTKIKKYRGIMARLRMIKGNPPLFANRLQVRTVSEKNTKGTFFNFDIQPAVNNDVPSSLIPPSIDGQRHPLLVAAVAFQEAVSGGIAQANYASQNSTTGSARDGDDEAAF